MSNFVLTTSSTCDLSKEYLKENNIPYVNFLFIFNNEEKYIDDFYLNISKEDFFNKIKNNDIKTSQPSSEDYTNLWEPILKEGKDIIHIELSSGISGAYNGACIIKNILLEQYKDRKIVVIDSLCASSGLGLLVDMSKDKYNEGIGFDELVNYIEDMKKNINHIFISTDLSQFIKGGRISKAAGVLGKVLNIIPLLHVTNEGKLEVIDKIRGTKQVIDNILKTMNKNIVDGKDYNKKIFISHSPIDIVLNDLKEQFKNEFKNADFSDKYVYDIGSTIAAHTGVGTVAIFYVGNGRI